MAILNRLISWQTEPQTAQFSYPPAKNMRFWLIDRIIELEPCVRITAVKTLTMTEEYLADHFPHFPVMPGVLMLESLTQAGAWLVRASEDFAHSMVVLKQANNVKYAQFVEPGQTLSVTAEVLKFDDGEVKLKAYGTMSGRIILTARLALRCYNLADEDPDKRCLDEDTRREMRTQLATLYQPRLEDAAANSCS
jgi:3-hydroxyacyl-[acyl-carrier-protein] dehydratase